MFWCSFTHNVSALITSQLASLFSLLPLVTIEGFNLLSLVFVHVTFIVGPKEEPSEGLFLTIGLVFVLIR